ncbi:MAG: hypothetical protein ACKOSR_06440 [Flavobacteriales bacterium]
MEVEDALLKAKALISAPDLISYFLKNRLAHMARVFDGNLKRAVPKIKIQNSREGELSFIPYFR